MIEATVMKSLRTAASTLVLLMVLSIFSSVVSVGTPEENSSLPDEITEKYATSPEAPRV